MSATEGTYLVPQYCSQCGSRKIAFKAMIGSNGALFCKYICTECGTDSKLLPKIENLQRRTNTPLSNWRKNVWKRDNCKCVVCGSKEDLHVHRIIPVSVSEKHKYVVGNGVTLCRECHRLAHLSKFDIDKIGESNG